MMDIAFEELRVSCFPEPITGTVTVTWDDELEEISVEEIDIEATDTLPPLHLQNRAGQPIIIQALFAEVEAYILDRHADEIDAIIPRPRFDPRREWGTYWGRP